MKTLSRLQEEILIYLAYSTDEAPEKQILEVLNYNRHPSLQPVASLDLSQAIALALEAELIELSPNENFKICDSGFEIILRLAANRKRLGDPRIYG